MPGITGIVELRGRPLDSRLLRAVDDAVSRQGVGIGKTGSIKTSAVFWQTGLQGVNPLLAGTRRMIVSAARIDNFSEVVSLVRAPPGPGQKTWSNNQIFSAAYNQLGTGFVNRLAGEFSLAVWDKKKDQLFLARDQFGNTSMYVYIKDHVLVFSSFVKLFLSIPGFVPRPDEKYVAGILTGFLPHDQATFYKDIKRLPPGHCLTATGDNIHVEKYYKLENLPTIRFARDGDYVDAFREIFSQAVNNRIKNRSGTGVFLSGGLDSSSVAVTAAEQLKREGEKLDAFTQIPVFDTENATDTSCRFGDESSHVKAIAALSGNIRINWVKSKSMGPVLGQRRLLDLSPEPIFGAGNAFWIARILEKAKEKGIRTLLTGQLGNATISFHGGGCLANLAKKGHWLSLVKEARSLSRVKNKSFWRLMAGRVGLPLVPARLYHFYARHWRDMSSVQDYSPIHPEFIRKIRLFELMRQSGHDPYSQPAPDTRQMRFKLIHTQACVAASFWYEAGQAMEINILDPTLDRRIVEFCFAIPDDQYLKDGIEKRLVKRALKGKLPDQVLFNRRKGLQAADIVYRIRQSAGEVETALNQIEQSDLARQYLDLEKMRQIYNAVYGPVSPRLADSCRAILMRGLMIGLCLITYCKE